MKSAWSRCSRPCRQRGPATLRVAAGWCHGTVNRTAEQLSKEGSTTRLEQGSDGIRCEGEQGELGLTVFPSSHGRLDAKLQFLEKPLSSNCNGKATPAALVGCSAKCCASSPPFTRSAWRVAAVSARHVGQAEGGSLRNAFGESPSGQKDS